ncbi:MAG: FAD-binding oxidoreductase [Rhodospirillaceae bacterium]|nr:FAD-binding oxidoreductase [Rhodospirillaceae bacterium]
MTTAEDDTRASALARIRDVVGPPGWIDEPDRLTPYLTEWRGLYHPKATAVVRPASTVEVAAVVRLCAEAGIGIVPLGGNTGLCGGAAPYEHGRDIILALERLNRIRAIDPLNYTITVEAGVILAQVQQAADAADRLFPLSLGAEGSCQIGGNLSTNAGGTGVLRYGNARDLALGLEVVLPDGQVWDGLRALRKDNTGYDLKHLFIGAEGTLGIITAAVLKLFPRPKQVETALIAVPDPDAAVALFALARTGSGDAVSAFELMPRNGIDLALAHVPGTVDPLAEPAPWYVLAELSEPVADTHLKEKLEAILEQAFERDLVQDAVIAASVAQARQLWFLREAIVEAQRVAGASIKHDVAVPVARVPELIRRATEAAAAAMPGAAVIAFGHVGDGNIHFNLCQPPDADAAAFTARTHEINHLVHDIVTSMTGSISAEHGIGRLKRDELAWRKSPVELELMRKVKGVLDPAGIMNPGKVV